MIQDCGEARPGQGAGSPYDGISDPHLDTSIELRDYFRGNSALILTFSL